MGLLSRLFGGDKKRNREEMLSNITTDVDPQSLWKTVGQLGEGTFGVVRKVKHAQTGEFAAAKVIPVESDEELEDYVVEADILTECPSEQIVGLRGAYLWHDNLWIVLELCEGGALDDVLIELEAGLQEAAIASIAHQVVKGLQHLHENHIIHRDLKAGNLLLTRTGAIRITDFGVSAFMKTSKKQRDTFIGTPYWMAPEVIICENVRDRPYTVSADIWSLGITLLELAETAPPYQDLHPMRVLFRITKSVPPTLNEPHKWSAEFSDFLRKCLQKDPSERWTASMLLQHDFIKNVTSTKACRDLLRLVKADIVERIEDLDEEQEQALRNSAVEDLKRLAVAADSDGDSSIASAPTATTTVVDGGEAFGFGAVPEAGPAAAAAQAIEPEKDHLKPPSGDKKVKTLTKTRTYVNEDGETVTHTTSRTVATALKHGHTMTRNAGTKSQLGKDWDIAEQHREAIHRKMHLRALRLIQKEEQKECTDLVQKLRAEREACDHRQGKELQELEKDCERELEQQEKLTKSTVEKLDKAQASTVAARIKTIAGRQAKQLKELKSENDAAGKAALSRVKSLPKSERRARTTEVKAEVAQAAEDKIKALQERQKSEKEHELGVLRQDLKAEWLTRRLELMANEHDLLTRRSTAIARMGENHVLEKQQILKHQLKATFSMQKHQMHYRHEKETEQLAAFHVQKLTDLDKKFNNDLKLLPKKHRSDAAARRKNLKRQLTKEKGMAQAEKLAEFDDQEEKNYRSQYSQMEEAFREAKDAMQRAMEREMEDLKQQQHMKKQMLLTNEKSRLKELELRHTAELRQFRQQIAIQKQQQKEEFEQHRQQIITEAVGRFNPSIL
eukprot:TRINITY_DN8595_c0_g1_i1.p1 TRINITY_DN8595_c0_g1~~TRINITY_DN8595_c0_g1_i1.p1  ORF type:complete len:845 (+),score=261.70 TRINITY_DN8595_c0_g1_i1:221-2755(+)